MTELLLSLKSDKEEIECSLTMPNIRPWYIDFTSSVHHTRRYEGHDLFECLTLLRQDLETEGWYILCAGARIDVYPSRMARDMGGGRKAYVMRLGVPAKSDDLVDTFATAQIEQVGTVEEQLAYYERWLKSL
jgi:hypothetical protein